MFPLHGPAPTNLPPGPAPRQRRQQHPSAAVGPRKQPPGPAWPGGGGGGGTAAAAAAPTAAQALVRGAGAVGLLYGGLYLVLAAFRAVKKRLLRRALQEIVPALQKAGVTFWVDFGSLMSLARNNDVYEHDNDVDLVVLDPDFEELLQKLRSPGVLPKGFTADWIGKSRDLGDGLKQRWIRIYLPGKVMWADLFGGFDFGSKIRINKNAHCDVPKDLVLPLGSIPMFDSTAPAPRDVEGVLQHRYGPDWRTPKYASKGSDAIEHNKRYLRVLRGLGRIGLRI
ncbi:hypothetical protein PLESTB_000653500 [Pleodorina starrii]|uniref:Uncharacterized protein n=1 Tax=Pleodorina starrii TaxID=330485 RepID=A0A9W6F1T3_9CHLO|nr:hypothetical protein PLESTM_001326600 [Pleodorina starrii]GLC52650.1 hypothetical protein PLESTB_000653500 [Pleodorina starrii]GLC71658.1 hypothetical protein PLESTF_001146400 [Pleodorina starrii]